MTGENFKNDRGEYLHDVTYPRFNKMKKEFIKKIFKILR